MSDIRTSAELFCRIHRKDGLIENFHFSMDDADIFLDLYNEMAKKCKSITAITKREFYSTKKDIQRIKIGETDEELIGYMEHYEP